MVFNPFLLKNCQIFNFILFLGKFFQDMKKIFLEMKEKLDLNIHEAKCRICPCIT